MIEAWTSDPAIQRLLERHPRVAAVREGDALGVRFKDGDRIREVRVGDPGTDLFGLIELMDNNPVVCADSVSVPGPAGTLALIALGPLAAAGIIQERPAFVASFEIDETDLGASLASAGWMEGADSHGEPQGLGSVMVASAMAVVATPEQETDLFDLYDERFGRSFFVRHTPDVAWSPDIVEGQPFAAYRISVAPDRPNSLLTVRVMADRNGKCGAAQVVHAMNVMCGFDDTLGIA